jgi:hypothetical protein
VRLPLLRPLRVLVLGQAVLHRQQPFRPEANVDLGQPAEAAREETRADQQHQRQRHLPDD